MPPPASAAPRPARCTQAGARVVVSARGREALDKFVAEHGRSDAIALDATDRDAMRDAAAHIVNVHGRIDLAMYCAGTYKAQRATDFDLDVALSHVQVNYVGALYMLDAVLPVLQAQAKNARPGQSGGHISLVSSVAGFRGLPQSLAYGPTKAALINLAEVLYLDLQPLGLGVSLINPGFVETPLTSQNRVQDAGADHARKKRRARFCAAGNTGEFEIHFPKRFTFWMKALRHLGYGSYFAAVRRSTGL